MSTITITILIADDHKIVREGFRMLIEDDPDMKVIAEAANGREAIACTLALHPDIVLMDIAMPQLNGLETTHQIMKALPTAKVILLSGYTDDAYQERAIEYGAKGFINKQASVQEIREAIRDVHHGKDAFSTSNRPQRDRHHPPVSEQNRGKSVPLKRLTPREQEVIQLIAEGYANKLIARTLKISVKTVEKHRESLMVKLDLHNAASITRYAINAGIIESSVPFMRLN